MARTGLSQEDIIRAALDLIDRRGIQQLTIHALAKRLNVKAPSLYYHFKGLSELKWRISTHVTSTLIDLFERKTRNKKGRDAIMALAKAYRTYGLKHPGRYQLSVVFPPQNQKEWVSTFLALRDLFGRIIRENYHLPEEEVRSAARTLRSLFHGFVSLELTGGWSQIVDIELSFLRSVEFVISGIELAEKKHQTRNRSR